MKTAMIDLWNALWDTVDQMPPQDLACIVALAGLIACCIAPPFDRPEND